MDLVKLLRSSNPRDGMELSKEETWGYNGTRICADKTDAHGFRTTNNNKNYMGLKPFSFPYFFKPLPLGNGNVIYCQLFCKWKVQERTFGLRYSKNIT